MNMYLHKGTMLKCREMLIIVSINKKSAQPLLIKHSVILQDLLHSTSIRSWKPVRGFSVS